MILQSVSLSMQSTTSSLSSPSSSSTTSRPDIMVRRSFQRIKPTKKIPAGNLKKNSQIFLKLFGFLNWKKFCWGRKKLKNAVVRETKRHFFLGFEMNFGSSEMLCNWFIPMEKKLNLLAIQITLTLTIGNVVKHWCFTIDIGQEYLMFFD